MERKILNRLQLFVVLLALYFSGCTAQKKADEIGLKDALKDKFLIGVAMNSPQIEGKDSISIGLIKKHFSSVVAENCMKSEVVQPGEGKFDFRLADQFVEFGQENKMFIVGHTLIWHSQAPKWFFVDAQGKAVTREVLIERMKTHITTVVKRYKGKVNGWDVVNEAIEDDGSWRQSPFFKIIGKDYVKLAFQFAHEADPDAELYYNDYSMAKEGRRAGVVNMVKELQAEGIKVAAIGMQGHSTMDYPPVGEFEKSMLAFAALGTKVMVTEMDITVLPFPDNKGGADVSLKYQYDPKMNPYAKGMNDSVTNALHQRYADFFRLFLKHKDVMKRVTVWGLTDGQSWRNDWPVPGRTDYPLLFDRKYQKKPIVDLIIKEASALKN